MIEIKDRLQSVEMLFGETPNIQYRIPIYQRRYVWDTLNWKSLWTDIESMYETGKAIFTGIIVTRQHVNQGDLRIYDIIDGQQRLTTFQIILCVISRRIPSEGWTDPFEIVTRARERITNADRLVGEVGKNARNKLCPKMGSADEEAFHALVNWSTEIPPEQDGEHIIYSAYRYFESQIQDYDYDRMVELYNNITLGINVAQINMISTEDNNDEDVTPEKLFASLNATGRMLSEFDYLRNDLFLRAVKSGDDLYSDSWRSNFEETNDLNLDTFLRTFLEANLGIDWTDGKEKPFDVYQTQYRIELNLGMESRFAYLRHLDQGIESEFNQLIAYAESYRALNTEMNSSESDVGRLVLFCDIHNLPRLDPFLLFVKHNGDDLGKVCEILESYIVRRMLCNDNHISTNKESYEIINEFFTDVLRRGAFNIEEFAKHLSETWPSDPAISGALRGAESKNAEFISYLFRQMRDWTENWTVWLGEDALDLQNQMTLLGEIWNYIEEIQHDCQELETLQNTFNDLWPPPSHFC